MRDPFDDFDSPVKLRRLAAIIFLMQLVFVLALIGGAALIVRAVFF